MKTKPTLMGQELIVFEADAGHNHEIERLMHKRRVPYRLCFGCWEGLISQSYIIHASDLSKIIDSEHLVGQDFFLHVEPNGLASLIEHRGKTSEAQLKGEWKIVDEKTAEKNLGWTYDRETGQYLTVA